MDCKSDQNAANCACTWTACQRRGLCCECLRMHLKSRQLPGCCFPPDAEKTYDRSFEAFARAQGLVK